MRKVWCLSCVWVALLWVAIACQPNALPPTALAPTPSPTASPQKTLQFQVHRWQRSVVYTLLIPAQSRFSVTLALAPSVDTLEGFAQKHQAIAVLNGGFFDPQNRQSTSFVVLQEKLVADPRQNPRLIHNPDLAPYLDQIFNRTEFRHYRCGETSRYEIARHQDPLPTGCRLVEALGGGPRLLPELTAVPEGFVTLVNGQVSRDPLGSRRANARTAIGLTADHSIVWVMAAQKPDDPDHSGLSLQALAEFMQSLGVEQAMNLDGGSSSSLYYQGKTRYGKVNDRGQPVQRPVKSVLLVSERS